MNGSTKVKFGAAEVSVDLIRRKCRDKNQTVRQFARGLKQRIAFLNERLGEHAPEGNLAKIMKAEGGSYSTQELAWCSDFQTYNDSCPEKVKKWLLNNYMNRFRNENR